MYPAGQVNHGQSNNRGGGQRGRRTWSQQTPRTGKGKDTEHEDIEPLVQQYQSSDFELLRVTNVSAPNDFADPCGSYQGQSHSTDEGCSCLTCGGGYTCLPKHQIPA